jgi:hypothetical protein
VQRMGGPPALRAGVGSRRGYVPAVTVVTAVTGVAAVTAVTAMTVGSRWRRLVRRAVTDSVVCGALGRGRRSGLGPCGSRVARRRGGRRAISHSRRVPAVAVSRSRRRRIADRGVSRRRRLGLG